VGQEWGPRVTALEDKLNRYKEPSSENEKDKQERAERMVREACSGWAGFAGIQLRYLPKGSYKNNTNVRQDSDVDIAVIHEGLFYFEDSALRPADRSSGGGLTIKYFGESEFRTELEKCLYNKFGTAVDTSGKTAITIAGSSSRVSTDVVPSFPHRSYYYDDRGRTQYHEGLATFQSDLTKIVNYPEQQYENGVAKNNRTGRRYKYIVRIMKRVENDLVAAGKISEMASYFVECLGYVVPDTEYGHGGATPLTDDLKAALYFIWDNTGDGESGARWNEPNGIKPLFGPGQKWSMADARNFARAAWNLLDLQNA
jgi:hypothetical protein